ncbi:hypothetical protein RHMOL_Rhmol03G0037900 [Rhododendron molle]|uniref:Uncharacterized protein n=1 Tax=Rhododendron molle TaxID=49168 RepID=A0ACC0PBB8_RHOML|nr:hypothetical protein RHMOL_Rhmol03G0037900 [Rhododendron molle]
MASSLSIPTFLPSPSPDHQHHGFAQANFRTSLGFTAKKCEFELNCSRDKEMDVSTSASASVDIVADCFDGVDTLEKEPSVSTMLLNFENKFDPFDALSTPLYQTATFKQVVHVLAGTHSWTENEMSMASDVFSLVTTEIVVVHVFVASIDNLFLLLLLAKRKEKYSSRYILSLLDCLYRTSPSIVVKSAPRRQARRGAPIAPWGSPGAAASIRRNLGAGGEEKRQGERRTKSALL